MEKQQPVENKMGVEPIRSLVLKMSFPMMVSMLMQAMYNIVDSIFVSRISENALTAVSLVFPYQMLIVAVAVGTGVGVNSLVARRLGEKRQEDANRAAAHGEFLSLLSGAAFGLLFALFTPQLIAVFNPDAEIYDYACTYLYYVGVPCIFLIFQCMFEKILQATGDTFHAMLSQLTGAIFNIVFDPILIFGLLGFPRLGVAGAAIATVLGQLLGMLVGMYYLHKDNGLIQVKLRGFRPQRQFISEIYRVGLPSIVMQAIGSVTNFGHEQDPHRLYAHRRQRIGGIFQAAILCIHAGIRPQQRHHAHHELQLRRPQPQTGGGSPALRLPVRGGHHVRGHGAVPGVCRAVPAAL